MAKFELQGTFGCRDDHPPSVLAQKPLKIASKLSRLWGAVKSELKNQQNSFDSHVIIWCSNKQFAINIITFENLFSSGAISNSSVTRDFWPCRDYCPIQKLFSRIRGSFFSIFFNYQIVEWCLCKIQNIWAWTNFSWEIIWDRILVNFHEFYANLVQQYGTKKLAKSCISR